MATGPSISKNHSTPSASQINSTPKVSQNHSTPSVSQISPLDIIEHIETAPIEDILDIIEEYHQNWIFDLKGRRHSLLAYIKKAVQNYGLELETIEFGTFSRAKLELVDKIMLINLRIKYKEQELAEEIKDISVKKIHDILRALIDADNTITNAFALKNSMTETDVGEETDSITILNRFSPMDTSENKPLQNMLLYLTECLIRNNYKRYKGYCCTRIFTEDGHDTHFWKQECTLKEFVYNSINEDLNYSMWQNMTSGKGLVKEAVEYFENIKNIKFPEISKDRNIFAFNNGIYFTKKWSDNIIGKKYTEGYIDEFISYGTKKIGSNIMVANYFNIPFNITTIERPNEPNYRYNDYFNIIIDFCPILTKIMKDQKWPEDVQRWLCIYIGRLLYKVGELDEWQVWVFLLGQAGTGKSTILTRIIKLFYPEVDIGTLSNNIEQKFGIGALYNKSIIIGPEIKGNFAMEQSEFQSIISGEDVQINIKNQTAKSEKWSVPGIMAGNDVPQFNDNAGSISRRLVVFLFNEKVREGDTQMGKKLKKELGNIIYACNRAYLDAVNKYGSSDVWNVMPSYFRDSRDEMAETTNALVSFIKSGKFIIDKNMYIKESLFIDEFNKYCKELNLGKAKWSKQYVLGPFSNFDLVSRVATKRYPNVPEGIVAKTKYIFGLDLNYATYSETIGDIAD